MWHTASSLFLVQGRYYSRWLRSPALGLIASGTAGLTAFYMFRIHLLTSLKRLSNLWKMKNAMKVTVGGGNVAIG